MSNAQLRLMMGLSIGVAIGIIALLAVIGAIQDAYQAKPGPGLCFPVVTLPQPPDQGPFCRYRP
ncbi:hypothetical protein [Nocardia sp. NPDC050175]|uniref:hypothetical protein n=1 Tax=Nocardia sp. NPDC050175 TaxID=3364317 RepID=UPI0037B33428